MDLMMVQQETLHRQNILKNHNMPKYIYIVIYLISVIVGVANYGKIKGTKTSYFLYFLLLGLITESLGYYIGFYAEYRNTFPVYNIYGFVRFIFYFIFFSSFIENIAKKKTVRLILVSYVTVAFVNFIFFQPSIFEYQLRTSIYGSFCFIITIIIYLIDLFNRDIILNLKHVLLFWVSIGNLLFFIGWLPVVVLSVYLNFDGIWDYTVLTLNIIMHTCFIIGFLWIKRKYNN